MTNESECDFTIARLDELWKLIQALHVLHGLAFPELLEHCRELLTRLTDDPGAVDFLEIRRFLDMAEEIIKPALRDLPEYQHALGAFLASCRTGGPVM